MSDKKNELNTRAKRVARLKKAIILYVVIGITLPWIFCTILFVKMHYLNKQIENLNSTLTNISEVLDSLSASKTEDNLSQIDVLGAENENVNKAYVLTNDEVAVDEGYTDLQETEAANTNITKVYLTFDDGPSIYTKDILDVLDKYGVKATFFVVGKEDERSREAITEIVNRGHSLGMHSYSHKYSELYQTEDSFKEDFYKLQNYLYELTGLKIKIYRFPGGSSNKVSKIDMHNYIDFLAGEDVTYFDWNISSGDGDSNSLKVSKLLDNSVRDVKKWNESVILLHDSAEKKSTLEALPLIIEELLAMEDVEILPITEDTVPVQHIK